MKIISRTLLAVYLSILVWLVLFKFSYDPLAVIRDRQTHGVNLIPFTFARTSEMIANVLVFVPLGVLLALNFKRLALIRAIALVLALSLALEIIQFTLSIGVADITDVITNTLGGAIGLACYSALRRCISERHLDKGVLAAMALIIAGVLILRTSVFIVKY